MMDEQICRTSKFARLDIQERFEGVRYPSRYLGPFEFIRKLGDHGGITAEMADYSIIVELPSQGSEVLPASSHSSSYPMSQEYERTLCK